MTALAGWETFYEIVGCSAGALIGLQFVAMTLIANRPAAEGQAQAGAAFATPTVVHFGAVLLLAGVVSAPWQRVTMAAVLWGLVGLSGIGYGTMVARHMRRQILYTPEFEDWLFYVFLPLAAYGTLAASAFAAHSNVDAALFVVGGAALMLLFTGIHNAWDVATYHIFVKDRG
ncbi:MAG: hypothetical protein JOZ33_01745 [Acidobacteriaceae bacterium]|nr:hypothetical protein [Acidobacteriaceae bacterium]